MSRVDRAHSVVPLALSAAFASWNRTETSVQLRSTLYAIFVFDSSLVLMLISLTDGSLATSSSPNQSQLSLPGLVALSSGSENQSQANSVYNNNNGLNVTPTTPAGNKNRSHSTTSLYNQHPNGKRLMRERKTVCSLHPLSSTSNPSAESSSSYSLLDALHCSADLDQQQLQRDRDRDDSENEAMSCSLPGSAVDSRRGSGISTRCVRLIFLFN